MKHSSLMVIFIDLADFVQDHLKAVTSKPTLFALPRFDPGAVQPIFMAADARPILDTRVRVASQPPFFYGTNEAKNAQTEGAGIIVEG